MIVFPNGKINLGLHITRKREDGYHDLETIFFPLGIYDILEFIPSREFRFKASGIAINVTVHQNLCVKAFQLLKDQFSELPDVEMYLHKVIPMGAGLGGGSADGSFALIALNEYFKLGLDKTSLKRLSLQLGSDCPFFISNQPSYAMGRGEILEPVSVDLSGFYIVMVYPDIAVSTAEAFAGIVPRQPKISLKDKVREPLKDWKYWMVNDFEKTVFHQYPEIAAIKKTLYASGAVYAAMTGSGSSCFGIFMTLPDLHFPDHYKVFRVKVK